MSGLPGQLSPPAMADAFARWLAEENLAVDTAQVRLMAMAFQAGVEYGLRVAP